MHNACVRVLFSYVFLQYFLQNTCICRKNSIILQWLVQILHFPRKDLSKSGIHLKKD